MEAVVAVGVILCPGMIVVDRRPDTVVVFLLRREGNDCGIPARYGGPRTSLPIVTGGSIVLCKMDMRVDTSERSSAH